MRILIALFCFALSATAPLWAEEGPVSLERALVRAAPKILEHCRQEGYANIGVLKFLVHKDGKPARFDNAGTLNMTLARQLETSLILANDRVHPLGIAENASAVAARTPGANHLTEEGRQRLFGVRYPRAWLEAGRPVEIVPDAFVTGAAGVSADLKTLRVRFFVFDRRTGQREILEEVVAKNSAARLSEMGESFASRGAFDGGTVEVEKRAGQTNLEEHRRKHEEALMALASKQEVTALTAPSSGPIALEVYYDKKLIRPEPRGGTLFLPEPGANQDVQMILKRTAKEGTYGMVLKVNGENTLYRQRQPDLHASKWISYPNDPPITVRGYQSTNQSADKFRVLTAPESAATAINYGADVGTMTLTVFAERLSRPRGRLQSREEQSEVVLQRLKPLESKGENFQSFVARLLDSGQKGLIADGARIDNGIRHVQFEPDPSPVMSLTLVYYRP